MIDKRVTVAIVAAFVVLGLLAQPLVAIPLTLSGLERTEIETSVPLVHADVEALSISPSADETMLHIQASGVWRSTCTPVLQNVTLSDETIVLTALADPADQVCGQMLSNWTFDLEIEVAAPAMYGIELIINSGQDDYSLYSTAIVNASVEIHLMPENPDPGDEIIVIVEGWHQNGCVPELASYQQRGETLIIEAATPGPDFVCGQAVTYWSIAAEVGSLDEGRYDIEINVTDRGLEPPHRVLYKAGSMSVGDGVRSQPVYTYYIPYIHTNY